MLKRLVLDMSVYRDCIQGLQTFERLVFERIVYKDCRHFRDWYLKGLFTGIADV